MEGLRQADKPPMFPRDISFAVTNGSEDSLSSRSSSLSETRSLAGLATNLRLQSQPDSPSASATLQSPSDYQPDSKLSGQDELRQVEPSGTSPGAPAQRLRLRQALGVNATGPERHDREKGEALLTPLNSTSADSDPRDADGNLNGDGTGCRLSGTTLDFDSVSAPQSAARQGTAALPGTLKSDSGPPTASGRSPRDSSLSVRRRPAMGTPAAGSLGSDKHNAEQQGGTPQAAAVHVGPITPCSPRGDSSSLSVRRKQLGRRTGSLDFTFHSPDQQGGPPAPQAVPGTEASSSSSPKSSALSVRRKALSRKPSSFDQDLSAHVSSGASLGQKVTDTCAVQAAGNNAAASVASPSALLSPLAQTRAAASHKRRASIADFSPHQWPSPSSSVEGTVLLALPPQREARGGSSSANASPAAVLTYDGGAVTCDTGSTVAVSGVAAEPAAGSASAGVMATGGGCGAASVVAAPLSAPAAPPSASPLAMSSPGKPALSVRTRRQHHGASAAGTLTPSSCPSSPSPSSPPPRTPPPLSPSGASRALQGGTQTAAAPLGATGDWKAQLGGLGPAYHQPRSTQRGTSGSTATASSQLGVSREQSLAGDRLSVGSSGGDLSFALRGEGKEEEEERGMSVNADVATGQVRGGGAEAGA